MKRVLIIFYLITFVVALTAMALAKQYRDFLTTPLNIPADGTVVMIESGSTVSGVIEFLAQQGVTQADWRWKLLTRLEPVTIRAGEYALEGQLYPRGLLEKLSGSDVVSYSFTIVEGWTFKQLLAELATGTVLEQEIQDYTDTNELLDEISKTIEHPEGWFLPETYQYVRGDSDLDILKRAHQAMVETLQAAWSQRADNIPIETPYQLLILASIIEKETALDEERTTIAGVFTRRLQRGMKLQTDPTVIYGMGDAYDGDIRRRDLQTDTPYNTYTRHGLPPTPIALPGAASLYAAAQPLDGDVLYFVANGEGGHTFSATLQEHNRAVQKMLRRKP